ncbi:hypothetical protein SPADD19_01128 [Streptococcus parasanguinis]|nr:hypothetical protein SPADD19_01128 [Streptococcus parasanguinis]
MILPKRFLQLSLTIDILFFLSAKKTSQKQGPTNDQLDTVR